jgi:hypothetical protein
LPATFNDDWNLEGFHQTQKKASTGEKIKKNQKCQIQYCTINPGNPNILPETIEILSAGNPDGNTQEIRRKTVTRPHSAQHEHSLVKYPEYRDNYYNIKCAIKIDRKVMALVVGTVV